MIRIRTALATCAALVAPALAAQHASGLTTTAPPEATQFDFLVGQWELDVRREVSDAVARMHGVPELVGIWKAWRAFDGFGIEDELRITDASGNPLSLSHSLRSWNAAAGEWTVVGLNVYGSRVQQWTGRAERGGFALTTESTDAEGRPVRIRTRFTDIGPERFRMMQDESTDNGRSWSRIVRIDARRVAAAAAR